MDFGLQNVPASVAGSDPRTAYAKVVSVAPDTFSTMWVADHLQVGGDPVRESTSLLAYLAGRFPQYAYGHLVLAQSFRNPALVAKMAATLSDLTDGRYILGLGAGWHEVEYRAFGYPFPGAGERIAQLEEAIEVIRRLWTEDHATFVGRYYRVDDARCNPRPTHHIPILVGARGPRALAVAARLADMWNWDGPYAHAFKGPLETLTRACEAVGRDLAEIRLTAGIEVSMPKDANAFEAFVETPSGDRLQILGPTPAEVIREIEILATAGVSHVQVAFDDLYSLERFANEVAPAVVA